MLNHNYIGTEHILLGLIHEGREVAAKALESMGISQDGVRAQVIEIIGEGQQATTGHIRHPACQEGARAVPARALQLGHNYIGTSTSSSASSRGEGVAAQVLTKLGADLNRVRQQVIQLVSATRARSRSPPGPCRGHARRFGDPRPVRPQLTQAAREGKLDPVIGREKEIERVMQVLSRRTKNNPVLIGEPGSGRPPWWRASRRTSSVGRAADADRQAALHPGPRFAGGRVPVPR